MSLLGFLTMRADVLDALGETLEHLLVEFADFRAVRLVDHRRIGMILLEFRDERLAGRDVRLGDGRCALKLLELPAWMGQRAGRGIRRGQRSLCSPFDYAGDDDLETEE